MPVPRLSRLFWKLLLALWLGMLLSMTCVFVIVQVTGQQPPRAGTLPALPLLTGTVGILITGVLLAWYLTRPLRHLRWALNRVAQGRFDTRVQPLMSGRRDEITDLADDFDRMAEQLEKLTESRRVLLHDISHELRSPLTRLQAAIGLLRQDPAQTGAMVDRIQRESERLDELIEELLTLHRLEAAPGTLARDRVDVIELLHAIAEDAGFEARAAGRALRIDAPGSFVTEVNGELLYRAFENVVRNAVKYTSPGTTVEIAAQCDPASGELVVTVSDRGPGVTQDQLARIFEPFVRLESAEPVRGTGLGLAITQRALTVHGGTIAAGARDGQGLVMTLRLPRAAALLS